MSAAESGFRLRGIYKTNVIYVSATVKGWAAGIGVIWTLGKPYAGNLSSESDVDYISFY
jgi:hypothetical protein